MMLYFLAIHAAQRSGSTTFYFRSVRHTLPVDSFRSNYAAHEYLFAGDQGRRHVQSLSEKVGNHADIYWLWKMSSLVRFL